MLYQNRYRATKQRRWTKTAVECYQIGCICKNCSLYEILGEHCMCKGAVLELVRTIGIPGEGNIENG